MATTDESNGFANSLDGFARNFYQHLVELNPQKDLICSPFSIQTCVGMVRMGAEDGSETVKQLDAGLNFSSNDVNQLADGFYKALNYYQQCSILKIANKVYVKQQYELRQEFKDTLTQKFLSTPDHIDFSNSPKAAKTINTWVESTTNSLIKDAVNPNDVNADTRLVLVNAIHFKGAWTVKFNESATQNENFFLDDKNKIIVAMMNSKQKYDYADLPSLEAKALRMAYKDSDLCMLIILPNQNTGLQMLQKKLQSMPLSDITSQIRHTMVSVKLPKFKIEFEQELTPVFKNLGIERMFTDLAEFGKMLQQKKELSVSKILHKAFIEVNEEGTEAAAAAVALVSMRSLPAPEPQPEIFHANHPFYYVIYDKNYGSLFMGNLNNPVNTTAAGGRCEICANDPNRKCK